MTSEKNAEKPPAAVQNEARWTDFGEEVSVASLLAVDSDDVAHLEGELLFYQVRVR